MGFIAAVPTSRRRSGTRSWAGDACRRIVRPTVPGGVSPYGTRVARSNTCRVTSSGRATRPALWGRRERNRPNSSRKLAPPTVRMKSPGKRPACHARLLGATSVTSPFVWLKSSARPAGLYSRWSTKPPEAAAANASHSAGCVVMLGRCRLSPSPAQLSTKSPIAGSSIVPPATWAVASACRVSIVRGVARRLVTLSTTVGVAPLSSGSRMARHPCRLTVGGLISSRSRFTLAPRTCSAGPPLVEQTVKPGRCRSMISSGPDTRCGRLTLMRFASPGPRVTSQLACNARTP
mmetsp:Transcript_3213/g.10790  ORF Transcript_3213/g.10790 Transcript_3213/m.10790 type:complete len:291 (+) Transcript_3213:1780-2652(+)